VKKLTKAQVEVVRAMRDDRVLCWGTYGTCRQCLLRHCDPRHPPRRVNWLTAEALARRGLISEGSKWIARRVWRLTDLGKTCEL
jgi:hypothetical protein